MTHKKALKKLMSIGMDRNTANRRLRMAYYSSLTNARIVAWQMAADSVYRLPLTLKKIGASWSGGCHENTHP